MLVHGDGDEEMLVLPRGSFYLTSIVFAAACNNCGPMAVGALMLDCRSAAPGLGLQSLREVSVARGTSSDWLKETPHYGDPITNTAASRVMQGTTVKGGLQQRIQKQDFEGEW